MAEVSPITPRMHAKGCVVMLEDALMTSELTRRRPRVPDYASENSVLVALAREMAVNPCNLLQTLVDKTVDLCRAGTAGISVLKTDTDGEYLACEVFSGVYAPDVGSRIPRHFSPSGTTLDRNAPQLFSYPARYFTYFPQVAAPIIEVLVVPIYVSGHPCGTVWIMAHDATRHFDAEGYAPSYEPICVC